MKLSELMHAKAMRRAEDHLEEAIKAENRVNEPGLSESTRYWHRSMIEHHLAKAAEYEGKTI